MLADHGDEFNKEVAIGRLPGWIAHWKEMHDDPNSKINRPRQIYTGHTSRPWVDRDKR